VLALSLAVWVGCGDELEQIDPGAASLAFVNEPEDARGSVGCDPVGGVGCSPTEKCGLVFASGVSVRAACVAEGRAGLGDVCVVEAGRDDCMRGLRCSAGVCKEMCRVTPDSCPAERYCAPLAGWFEVGVCEPACDLFGDDCEEGEGCFLALRPDGYATLCAPRFIEPIPSAGGCGLPGALAPGVAGDCCSYVNTCAPGFVCVWSQESEVGEGVCAYLCDPTGQRARVPRDCDPPGPGPEPSYVCKPLREVDRNVGDVPDSIGVCVQSARG